MRSWSRAGGGGLRRGRQSVAHGGVAAAADVRAVDGGEVAVGLGRREQAAGAEVPALGRERAEEGAGGGCCDGVDEEGAVLLDFNMIQKAPIEIVCQASRSITAHASPAHALSADNSDSPLLNLRPRASWGR